MATPAQSVPESHAHLYSAETCEWCGQSIPPDQLEVVRGRIAARERQLSQEAAAALRQDFERERSEEANRHQGQLVAIRAEAERQTAERERAAREQGVHEGQANAVQRVADLTAQLSQTGERASQAEAARQEMEQQLQALRQSQEVTLQQRLREQHEALGKDKEQALRESDARGFAKQQKLQETVDILTRQVQQMTAHELGEGAEINLYDVLKAAFESDRIRRVPKGTAGADHIHEVVHHGKVAGRIVYDAKNRNDYKSEYAKKLRSDQIAARADFAILSTNRFPKNARQLHIDSQVILVCPARVVVLAAILRRHILQMHALRLSNEEREAKTEALYKYITSEPCSQLLESIDKLVRDLQDMEVAERKAHSSVWEKRGKLLASVLKANGELLANFERIIGTRE